ncbi:MAG: hypothetical protein GX088_03400 [Clostridia bacterium]|nr:hypothetical protein [Clostridia bacterium]
MPAWMMPFIKGLVFGTAVGVLNNYITVRAAYPKEELTSEKAKRRLGGAYIFRYIINFVALFLVYKNIPMLLGTALGLAVIKNIILISYILKRKG